MAHPCQPSTYVEPTKPLTFRPTVDQTADGARRTHNRRLVDRQRRWQKRGLQRRRTALRVLRQVATNPDMATSDPALVTRAHEVLDMPWARVSKWANRCARLEAREGKREESIAKSIAAVQYADAQNRQAGR
jgi:hypothetical protein